MGKKWGIVVLLILLPSRSIMAKHFQLLNVSYDPTREFYQEYNRVFSQYWHKKTGDHITIRQSHGGSGKQVMSVINGIEADVVTLALAFDVNILAKYGWIDKNWISRFPDHAAPYTSTIVFLVRKGNPKQIYDWSGLIKPGISIIMPNPKTSGGARWNYLAAWGYALHSYNHDQAKAQEFVNALFKNVVVLDSGSRSATNTFVDRGQGDVLIAWENEALLVMNALNTNHQFEIVTPSESILTEPTISVVDKVVDKRGTRDIAHAYLSYLYSNESQRIAAKHYYRPRDSRIAQEFSQHFPTLKLFTLDEVFGNWETAQKEHFLPGGSLDQINQHLRIRHH